MKNYFNVQGFSFVMVIYIGYRTDYNVGIDEIRTMAVILMLKMKLILDFNWINQHVLVMVSPPILMRTFKPIILILLLTDHR